MKQNVYRQRKLRQVDGTAVKEALRNWARPEIAYRYRQRTGRK